MTHRAAQIIDAIASLVRARVEPSGVHVYTHRRESLSAEQDELPAVSVDAGDEEPGEFQPLRGITSVLDLVFTAVAKAPSEPELRVALFDLRDATDQFMGEQMDSQSQAKFGLSFVYGIGYGGATKPEVSTEGGSFAGSITSTWKIGYRLR